MRVKLLLYLMLFVFPGAMIAQVPLTGSVVDARNNAISGVTVRLKNTNTGTVTDSSGRFAFTAPGKTGIVEFSIVGYKTQSISLKNAADNIAIVLQEDIGKLEEVVVTGLASTVKRSNLGNAVSSVSAKQLTGTVIQPTMDAALYGKFTGSNISANSGAPGGGISIKLRGITSLVANSQPLFIVDGVYYDNSSIVPGLNLVSKAAGQGSTTFQDNQSNRIADLDPEDIDRIEILKGASGRCYIRLKGCSRRSAYHYQTRENRQAKH